MDDQRGTNISPYDGALWAAEVRRELAKFSMAKNFAYLYGPSKSLTRKQRFIRKCQRLSSWLINRLPPAWREIE